MPPIDCTYVYQRLPSQDLAVKMEGNFILRYRCFDLFSKVSGTDPETPVWAECYGGQFRVYSTKEFPGLRASTDLTKVRSSILALIHHIFPFPCTSQSQTRGLNLV